MTFLVPEELQRRWNTRLERPFWRLLQLFLERIFRGGGDSGANAFAGSVAREECLALEALGSGDRDESRSVRLAPRERTAPSAVMRRVYRIDADVKRYPFCHGPSPSGSTRAILGWSSRGRQAMWHDR